MPDRKARCPACGQEFTFENLSSPAARQFPFCSERCRMVDLGRWLTGQYAIPGDPLPPPDDE